MRPFKSLLSLASIAVLGLILAAPADAHWGLGFRSNAAFRAGFNAGQRDQFRNDFRQFNGGYGQFNGRSQFNDCPQGFSGYGNQGFRAGFSFGY